VTTITRTSDSATTTPTFVQGYEASFQGRNVIHQLIGGGIAVVLIPQDLRSGTLDLYYTSRADAWDAAQLHIGADTFTLSDADVPEIDMLYAAGTVSPVLEIPQAAGSSTTLWRVGVEYQELEP